MTNGPKQVILVRKDLRMKRASIAALVAKASAEFFLDNDESNRADKLSVNLTPQESEWLSSGSTRIVLGVPTESVLKSLAFKAEIAGLQCYQITGTSPDASDSDFSSETLCVAIGPDESDKIDEITGNLKLF
jgi:peptidyl-tRNA hydrolase